MKNIATKSTDLQQTLYSLLRHSPTSHHLKQIHCRFVLLSLYQDHFLLAYLISLCCRFQDVHYAFTLYAHTPNPNIHLFNTILHSFHQTPSLRPDALRFYILQLRQGQTNPTTRPNRFTFPPLLTGCTAAFSSLALNQEIHSHILKYGTYLDVYVSTALLDSYSKLGNAIAAARVFEEMPVRNIVTYNSLVSGLGRCGEMGLAREAFDTMPEKNLVSWTCMIAGYARNGYYYETLSLFREMESLGVKPNQYALASTLIACANLGALELGKKIHSMLEEAEYGLDLFVGSALIDMYTKCGMVEDARRVFEKIPEKNVVVFSAMIVGLAMNGRGLEALGVFRDMILGGILPNDITFVGVLCACCHIGLVDKGWYYFNVMTKDYSMVPKLQHYACMVDLLGRAGHLGEAYRFIMSMPIEPDVVVWGALLGACKIHKKVELGKFVAHQILEIDPRHSGSLVFLSKVYASGGDLGGVRKVQQKMRILGIKKTPGNSWIEVKDVVYQFFAGDTSHPQSDRIYAKLDELAKLLEVEGYSPDTHSVVCDVEEEEKKQSVFIHSEKLAVAFGLINLPEGINIRIVKNLRICDDCHLAIKLVSKIVRRDIVVRDSNRFHHFSEGTCSCQDYW
ncbi:pentatricopeptide repeat-containing protein At4g21065-like [Aristolochia californica]|uniref:pentatricopeptide repeat-containing protein At4g21065-like n=1 Tax=Aristolochia californica TaxID=171875 RepID=UPI0035DFCF41